MRRILPGKRTAGESRTAGERAAGESGAVTSGEPPVSAVRRLEPRELPEMAALLASVGLDPVGLEGGNVRAFGMRDAFGLAASAAYEREGRSALLRSLAVRPDLRGRGLGSSLAAAALEAACREGAEEVLLLTEGAAGFFAASGWQPVARAYVDERFPDSEQVRHVCPGTAAALRKDLARGDAGARSALSVADVRGRFPALSSGAVFLDGPGGTQVPASVIAAMADYLACRNANLGGFFETSRASDELVAGARAAAARFLGATPEEVVFGANMTSLNFTLTRALARELRPGDEVVVTELDHDANVSPWLLLGRDLGLTVRFARMADDFTLDLEHLAAQIGPRTRVVAFPWASNAIGTVVDAARVAELAHAAGALAWVDAVHYAPHAPIDAAAAGADVLLCSPYKFFGPHMGIAVGRRDLLERLQPYKVRPAAETPAGHRFETGTLAHEALAGLVAAVEYLESVGFEAIQAHERELGRRFLDGLTGLPHLRLWGRPAMEGRVATFAFTSSREPPARMAERLAAERIYVWHGHFYAVEVVKRLGLEPEGVLRAGFVHYNTVAEVDRLLEALA
jgi:cysteine desulfurase family protein (TIGR01976 family)